MVWYCNPTHWFRTTKFSLVGKSLEIEVWYDANLRQDFDWQDHHFRG